MTNVPNEGGYKDAMGNLHVSNGESERSEVTGSEEKFWDHRVPHSFQTRGPKLESKVTRGERDLWGGEGGPQDSSEVIGNPMIGVLAKVNNLALGGVKFKPHGPVGGPEKAKNFRVREKDIVCANRCVVSETSETKGARAEVGREGPKDGIKKDGPKGT